MGHGPSVGQCWLHGGRGWHCGHVVPFAKEAVALCGAGWVFHLWVGAAVGRVWVAAAGLAGGPHCVSSHPVGLAAQAGVQVGLAGLGGGAGWGCGFRGWDQWLCVCSLRSAALPGRRRASHQSPGCALCQEGSAGSVAAVETCRGIRAVAVRVAGCGTSGVPRVTHRRERSLLGLMSPRGGLASCVC